MCCFSQHARHGVYSSCSYSCVEQGVDIYDSSVCTVCVNHGRYRVHPPPPSIGAITDHSQSSKNTDTYFKSKLYVKDPNHRNPVFTLPYLLGKARGANAQQKLIPAGGCDSNPQLMINRRVIVLYFKSKPVSTSGCIVPSRSWFFVLKPLQKERCDEFSF